MRFLAKKSGRPSPRVPLGDHDRESMREDDGMRMRVVVDLYFGQKNRLQKVGINHLGDQMRASLSLRRHARRHRLMRFRSASWAAFGHMI